MKKNILIATMCVVMSFIASAQTASLPGISRFSSYGLQSIIDKNEVKGYFIITRGDKVGKGMRSYGLTIYDNNLTQTHNIDLKKSDKLTYLESAFNGERFCFAFIDFRAKALEYTVLDKQGKEVGTYKVLGLSSSEIQTIQTAVGTDDGDFFLGTLAPIPGKGFVRYGIEKTSGMRISIETFDNNAKKMWESNSGATTKKSYESAANMYVDDKVVASQVTMRPKMLSTKDLTSVIVFHNVDNGKELFKVDFKNAKYGHLPDGVSYDDKVNQYFVYGEFTKPDDIVSLGFFIHTYDATGKMAQEKYFEWGKDIFSKMPASAKEKLPKNMYVSVHKMIRTSDGNFFAIGEQYRKAVSGTGVALAVLAGATGGNSGVALIKIELYNMMVYQFNKDMNLEKVEVIEKDKSNVQLPRGAGVNGGTTLGYYLKMTGEFDYAFTTISTDKSTFNASYINYDRDKDEGNKSIVGNISYTNEKKIAVDKVDLTTKASQIGIRPAKPGYVFIYEYYRKKKTLDLRLEKLNF